jgi:hypothetical protein
MSNEIIKKKFSCFPLKYEKKLIIWIKKFNFLTIGKERIFNYNILIKFID